MTVANTTTIPTCQRTRVGCSAVSHTSRLTTHVARVTSLRMALNGGADAVVQTEARATSPTHAARNPVPRPRGSARSTSTSAAVCDEGEDTLSVFNSTLFELFLGRSNGPDFGFRIHHAGNGVVVHVTIAGEQLLDAGNAFFLGLVRQHRPANDVAGRKDARHGRLVMRVDRDEAAFVCCHSDGFQAESFGIRLAADSDQYAIAFD